VSVSATADLDDIVNAVQKRSAGGDGRRLDPDHCALQRSGSGRGSVGQLREVTARMVDLAKARGMAGS